MFNATLQGPMNLSNDKRQILTFVMGTKGEKVSQIVKCSWDGKKKRGQFSKQIYKKSIT